MSIELKNVTKTYGGVRALDSVSVTFSEGGVYGLLGANGAGKTTMLNIITNRIYADGGEVLIDGESAPGNDRALGKVYMMAEANLFPDSMRVEPALRLTGQFYPGFDMDYALGVAKKFELPLKKKGSPCRQYSRCLRAAYWNMLVRWRPRAPTPTWQVAASCQSVS